jgi:hypothetical protein
MSTTRSADGGRRNLGVALVVIATAQLMVVLDATLEAAAGATRLVNSVRLDPSPAMLRLLAPLATSRIKASVAQNLGKLRLVLEGGGQPGPARPGPGPAQNMPEMPNEIRST